MIGDLRYRAGGRESRAAAPDSAPRVRFFAAEALGRIAYKPAAAPIVAMLAANDDKDVYLRHAGSLALSRIGDAAALARAGAAPSARRAHRRGRRAAPDAQPGRRAVPRRQRRDRRRSRRRARSTTTARSRRRCRRWRASLEDKRFTSEPLLRRAISANLKVGSAEALARLAAFAADTSRPQRDARRSGRRARRLGGSVADGSRRRHLPRPGKAARRLRPRRPRSCKLLQALERRPRRR